MLGEKTINDALSGRPSALIGVADDVWDRLVDARRDGLHPELFAAAWENGGAFLAAKDGLRNRLPLRVEWRGPLRPVGYEAVPADLRIDHVFLVSCKHRSKLLHNVSPANIFDRGLASARLGTGSDWFLEVAAAEYQALYARARDLIADTTLPENVADVDAHGRHKLKTKLPKGRWPIPLRPACADFAGAVSSESARRWSRQLTTRRQEENQLWRLLRNASAPYFLLGATPTAPLRLRIATPWDWRQHFEFMNLTISEDLTSLQPQVGWRAEVREKGSGTILEVKGLVEVRWSHGKFGGWPEAKVQLITAHEDVPGYFPLI